MEKCRCGSCVFERWLNFNDPKKRAFDEEDSRLLQKMWKVAAGPAVEELRWRAEQIELHFGGGQGGRP